MPAVTKHVVAAVFRWKNSARRLLARVHLVAARTHGVRDPRTRLMQRGAVAPVVEHDVARALVASGLRFVYPLVARKQLGDTVAKGKHGFAANG